MGLPPGEEYPAPRFAAKPRWGAATDARSAVLLHASVLSHPTTHQRIAGANGPRLYSGWKGDDSGHLNAAGSRAIALELIAFLAGKR